MEEVALRASAWVSNSQKFNFRIETPQAVIVRLEKEIVDAQNLLGIKADDKKRTGVKSKSRKKNNGRNEKLIQVFVDSQKTRLDWLPWVRTESCI